MSRKPIQARAAGGALLALGALALCTVVLGSAARGGEAARAATESDASGARDALEATLQQTPEWDALPEGDRAGLLRTAAGSSVWTVAEQFEHFVDGGYAAPDGDVLELIWDGAMTEHELTAIRDANVGGLEIRVVEAAHSDAEISHAVDRVSAALRNAGIEVEEITSDARRASLLVTLLVVAGHGPTSDGELDRARALADAAAGGIPVVVSVGDPIDLSRVEADSDGVRSTTFETGPSGGGTASPRILTAEQGGHFLALLSGVLGVNELGCVTLDDEIVVAPIGSTVSGMTVRLPGYPDLTLGTAVEVGGGHESYPVEAAPAGLAGCTPDGSSEVAVAVIAPG